MAPIKNVCVAIDPFTALQGEYKSVKTIMFMNWDLENSIGILFENE